MPNLLALVITADHTTVAWQHAGSLRVKHVARTQRGYLVRHVAAVIPSVQCLRLQGVIVASTGLSFSATRELVTVANALAFAAHCPVTLVQPADGDFAVANLLRTGARQLRTAPRRTLTPKYAAAPHITAPRGAITHHVTAGGIVADLRAGTFLFVQRKDSRRLGLPKGHQEAGESLVQTARREIAEETGIVVQDHLARLPTVRFLFREPKDRSTHRKEQHNFLFQRTARRDAKRLQTGEVRNLQNRWLRPELALRDRHLYSDLKPVIEQAVTILRRRGLWKATRQATR